MVSKIKRTVKYDKNIHPTQYFLLCSEGNSLTATAAKMGTVKEQLMDWSKDPQKHEWKAVWQRGKEAFQAFWENELQMATRKDSKATSSQIDAIKYILKTQCKDDWAEKQESKIEISHLEKLSTDELDESIFKKAKIIPNLKVVGKKDELP